MKKDVLSNYLHFVPPVLFLALAAIVATTSAPAVFEPRYLLPLLNTTFLSVLSFTVALLAARSYVRGGSRSFILFGCGMVAFGMGSLLGGWGLARYGQNLTVTVHNVGSLLGGLCHFGGVAILLLGPREKAHVSRRAAALACVLGYSAAALFLMVVSLLAVNGSLPIFFVQGRGPTITRQVVLTFAGISYLLCAIRLLALHAQTRGMFFGLYADGLFLLSIGLASLMAARNVGSLISWTGRAAQYVGSVYLIAAMLVGIRESRRHRTPFPDYLRELIRSHVEDQVKVRTSELVELNRRLQDEVTQRRIVEDELRLSRDELKSVYDHSPVLMCILDAEHKVLYANRALSDLVGVPEARLIGGRAPGVFGCVHEGAGEPGCGFGLGCQDCEVRRAIEDTLKTGQAHHEVKHHLTLERGGVRRDAHLLSSTVRLPGSCGPRLLLTLLDVTDQKRAEEHLRENESLYRTSIEDSLQGFAIVQDGRIVLCNDALCRLSGYSAAETYVLSAREVRATVHHDDRSRVGKLMRQVVEEGKKPPPQVIRLVKKDGESNWVEMLCASTTYKARPALQLTFLNRTEEIRVAAEYRSLFENAMYGMAVLQNGRILFANQALTEIWGYSVAELLAMSADQVAGVVHPEDRERVIANTSMRSSGGEVPAIQPIRFIRKDGSLRYVEAQSARIDYEGAPAVQVIFRDVTADQAMAGQLERIHQKMRNLAAHLVNVREEERRLVAQDIHDQLGQTLAALKMDLHWIAKRIGGQEEVLRDKFAGTIELSGEAISAVQRIAADLRPRMLDDLGLAPALDWLGAEFARRTKIACTVKSDFPPDIVGRNATTALYRIAQEALANVGLHSHADHVTVRLYASDGALNLLVEDDGIGISEEQATAPDSFGLIGMRERVERFGGSLSISGESGFGSIIVIRILLPKEGVLT